MRKRDGKEIRRKDRDRDKEEDCENNGQEQRSSGYRQGRLRAKTRGFMRHLRAEIFADGRHVHSRCCSDTAMASNARLEMSVDTSNRKLQGTMSKGGRGRCKRN
eukprot:768360-Hanusia_phi.AAC.4